MPFALVCQEGSLAGSRFALGPEPVEIGRSRACAIRPSEPDVSGRHVRIDPGPDGGAPELTVLSAHRTEADGVRVATGAAFPLRGGMSLRLGSSLFFRIESTEPAVAVTSPADAPTGFANSPTGVPAGAPSAILSGLSADAPTGVPSSVPAAPTAGAPPPRPVPAAPPDPPEADETQMLRTQLASAQELSQLRSTLQRRRRNRFALRVGLLGAVFVAVVGTCLVLASRRPESGISMPRDPKTGRRIDRILRLHVARIGDGTNECAKLYVPCVAPVEVVTNVPAAGGAGLSFYEAMTRVGRDVEVPLRLSAWCDEDPATLCEDADSAFERWLSEHGNECGDESARTALPDTDFLASGRGLSQGILCRRRQYARLAGGESWIGIVSFYRYGAARIAVRREIPAAFAAARGVSILEKIEYFVVIEGGARSDYVRKHWEGRSGDPPASPSAEFARCEKFLSVRKPEDWDDLEARISRVLAATQTSDDPSAADLRARALLLLRDLRDEKTLRWNNFYFERRKLRPDERGAIRALEGKVQEVFRDPEDARHFLVRRKDWWVADAQARTPEEGNP